MECSCGAIPGGTNMRSVGTETSPGGAPASPTLRSGRSEATALRLTPRRSKGSVGKRSRPITGGLSLSGKE